MAGANGSEVVRCSTYEAGDDFTPPGKVAVDDDVPTDTGEARAAVDEDLADHPEIGYAIASIPRSIALRGALAMGLTAVFVLLGLAGWLGLRGHQARQEQLQHGQLLQAARQGALNLTTIDWQHAEADVQRIIEGATGEFYDDFVERSRPFIDVIKKFQSTSVGTVAESALERATTDSADALVAVTVNTENVGGTEQVPRSWRLRVSVQRIGEQIKVANVEFVP